MIALQERLRAGASPEELVAEYKLSVKRHRAYPNLVQFKYHQFESPFTEQLVREARGIILDESANWNVVSFPYTKFFNHGEPLAAVIDWKTARAYEKLDGSLCTLYWYAGNWHVATSGTPDANTPVNDNADTFEDLFWRTFDDFAYHLDCFDKNHCLMFELMTPSNQIVVRHAKPRLVLHGARDLRTLLELPPTHYAPFCCEGTPSFPLQTLEQVLAAAVALNPLEQEGFVICDAAFNRVKIKSPAYVALHRAKDGMSPRTVRNIVRTGEQCEFIAHFPELEREVSVQRSKHEEIVSAIEMTWQHLRCITDRKTFALEATKHPFSGVLFALFSGKTSSAREYLAQTEDGYYEKLLEAA